ncbi:hypothetical protein PHMEG_00014579 [Phytophthora megakarya]|uniref:BED-type domain-containing protein n=1 Tax=Phytophthora megakarya TaxID=4795 RepID=A0A225W5Z5_9STRA|nr:hypothetical protein PHMEG_00014579 [Phytophthora megakarya]
MKIGRPPDPIWQHYFVEKENGKKHGRCRYCGALKKNGKPSGKLLKHLTVLICALVFQKTYKFHCGRLLLKNQLQDAFEIALARVFFVCALSFMLADAPLFRKLLALVAPTFKVPSRHKLRGELLK